MLVQCVGWIAVLWGILIVVVALSAGQSASWMATIASALLVCVYGGTLVARHPVAYPLTWTMVALFGGSVVLNGLVPISMVLWALLLWFALHLRKHRTLLDAPAVETKVTTSESTGPKSELLGN